MLWLERHVVATLSRTVAPARRPAIAEYVDGVLGSMPEVLRFGVAAESVVLGADAWISGRLGSPRTLEDKLAAWEQSRIGVIRQYVRLLSSLVMFADQELPRGEDAA